MNLRRLLSEYRWPIYLGFLLTLPIVASGVLVYVATRPDAPRPIPGYYEAARAWDADEAVEAASRELGWSVRYELPAGVPHYPGMPRPVDVRVSDRSGRPVAELTGSLFAVRPADTRLNQVGALAAMPQEAGSYRTLLRLDQPGLWEVHLDVRRDALRFVHTTRFEVPAGDAAAEGAGR